MQKLKDVADIQIALEILKVLFSRDASDSDLAHQYGLDIEDVEAARELVKRL